MVVDCHCYLGTNSLFGKQQDSKSLLAVMDGCGVDRAIVSPFRPIDYDLSHASAAALELARANPDRLTAYVRVDPWQGEAALVEARTQIEHGSRGIFLHPFEECFFANDNIVWPLALLAEKVNRPLFIRSHPWNAHATQLADLARRFPRVFFIVSHGANLDVSGRGLADALRLLRDCPNVAIVTCGVYRTDFLEDVVRELGADRVLFGSAAPELDMAFEVERVRMADLGETSKAAVLGGNGLALL